MDLKVNLVKIKLVIFRKGSGILKKMKFWWGEGEVQIVNEYVYLGVLSVAMERLEKIRRFSLKKRNQH